MRGRKPRQLVLLAEDVTVLQRLVHNGKTEQRVARRARILLAVAEGERIEVLAQRVERDPSTIWRICRRYERRGVQAVYDAPRPGRRCSFSPSAEGAHRKSRRYRTRAAGSGADPLVH